MVALTLLSQTTLLADITNGLVAYYPLDGNANNVVGNGNNGTLSGGVSYASGIRGAGAAVFNGNGGVTATTVGFPVGSSSRTVALWARVDEDVLGTYTLISYGQYGVRNRLWTLFAASSTKAVEFSQYGDHIWGGIWEVGGWHHYITTTDGTLTYLYEDGFLLSSNSLAIDTAPDFPLEIGGNLVGAIDDVRIYNRALSLAEIQQLASAASVTLTGLAISPQGTILENSTNQFTCTATYSDGGTSNVTTSATWSLNPALPGFSITNGQLVAGGICQPSTNIAVIASHDGMTATNVVTVTNVPHPVTNLRVAAKTPSTLLLDWNPPSVPGGGTLAYEVERRQFGQTTWLGQSVSTPPFAINGLESGSYYEVRVRAVVNSCAEDWVNLDTPELTVPTAHFENPSCRVYRLADVPREDPRYDELVEKLVGDLISHPIKEWLLEGAPQLVGEAVMFVGVFDLMSKVIGELATIGVPEVTIVPVSPSVNGWGSLVVKKSENIHALLLVDARNATRTVHAEPYLESGYHFAGVFAGWVRVGGGPLMTDLEAEALFQPGHVYLIAPKTPLSSGIPGNVGQVRGGYGVSHDQRTLYVGSYSNVVTVEITNSARLCMGGRVGTSNETAMVEVATNGIPSLPHGLYPQMALNIMPDDLVFDQPAMLTFRRQTNFGNFTSNAVISRFVEGVWEALPTAYDDNRTTDLGDDVWTAFVDHLCYFALTEREVVAVGCTMDGPNIVVSWNARTNLQYTLLSSTNVAAGSWQPVEAATNQTGNGAMLSFTNSATANGMFYKVRIE